MATPRRPLICLVAAIGFLSASLCGHAAAQTSTQPATRLQQDHVPTISIPRLSMKANLHTNFKQPPWSNMTQLTGFLAIEGKAPAQDVTKVYIAYDADFLRVGFRCEGQHGDGLRSDATDHDEAVWRDDSVELLICPSAKREPLYQFIVNSAGVTYDARGTDRSWNPTWQANTATDETGYSVVMLIPFDILETESPPLPGHVWRMNFCRNTCHDDTRDSSSWSPTVKSLNDSRYCGWVEFGNEHTPVIRLSRVDPVVIGTNQIHIQASPPLQFRIRAIDQTGNTSLLTEGPLETSGLLPFRLDDDGIRQVELSLLGQDGREWTRARYPMTSPELSTEIAELRKQFADISRQLDALPEKVRPNVRTTVESIRPLLEKAVAATSDPRQHTADNWNRLAQQVTDLKRRLDSPAHYARTLANFPKAGFAVGLARPTQKIMIQGYPFAGWVDDHYDLKVARNEHEGFQVVVMPFQNDLHHVTVSASVPRHVQTDQPLPGSIDVSLVGHVDVVDNTRYQVEHHGWWPDPLLSFQNTCDIRNGEHVAFWIDVATRADTPAGRYQGSISVTAQDCNPIQIILNVDVWNFTLPAETHLANAFTYNEGPVGRFHGNKWDQRMKHKYYDLILDHRLNIDHLYRREPPDIEVLEYGRKKGQTGFNVGGVFRHGTRDPVSDELEQYLSDLKDKGLFQYAYVYGYDEVKRDKFEEMREVFGEIHERYPGLKTMTTAIDFSYGRDTGLRDVVDIWVPLTDWYDFDEARTLRHEGKQVWWYICVVPEHPYANWFIEYPAIETRLLMGAMSYKYEVDGFLYYMINRWRGNHHPITSGPYTNWNPGSFANKQKAYTANGDGSLICPGPDGPLSTIRMENIRDGLEDYEYLYLLARRAKRIQKLPTNPPRRAYLGHVDELLRIPPSIVRDLTTYTHDTGSLEAFRSQVAEAILESTRLMEE